jgi:hypothetical protein
VPAIACKFLAIWTLLFALAEALSLANMLDQLDRLPAAGLASLAIAAAIAILLMLAAFLWAAADWFAARMATHDSARFPGSVALSIALFAIGVHLTASTLFLLGPTSGEWILARSAAAAFVPPWGLIVKLLLGLGLMAWAGPVGRAVWRMTKRSKRSDHQPPMAGEDAVA